VFNVVLVNIYVAAGMPDQVQFVRDPGCSWTEVNKKVHTFLAA
jgi:hypothetical protein